MVLLKNLIKHPWVQAMLKGMQPCVIGIILATGLHMTGKGLFTQGALDFRAVIIGLILAALIPLSKKLPKKKISAIQMIMVSAVLGILFYGV